MKKNTTTAGETDSDYGPEICFIAAAALFFGAITAALFFLLEG